MLYYKDCSFKQIPRFDEFCMNSLSGQFECHSGGADEP
jgi:hypothetical protein